MIWGFFIGICNAKLYAAGAKNRFESPFIGVVQVGQVPRFFIFLKSASRLVPDGWVGPKSSGDRCHFWTFQLELDILDTKNIGIGSVDTKLRLLEVG